MVFLWPIPNPPATPLPAGLRFGALRTTTDPPHPHGGIDLGTFGTKVLAAANGLVKFASAYEQLGGPAMVYLTHDGGFETRYMHLDPAKLKVRQGSTVVAGQQIGAVGMLKQGPSASHLHFEVLKDGTRLDPEVLLGAAAAGAGLLLLGLGLLAARFIWKG